MSDYMATIRKQIGMLENVPITLIYYPKVAYRREVKEHVIVRKAYTKFCDVEIFTKEYGSYHTTIAYIDIANEVVQMQRKEDSAM